MNRCIVIPAIKKSAVIPDQLVKKLAGKTLIQRALDTALAVAPGEDILVVTDSDEIRLICGRAGVGCEYDPAFRIESINIVTALRQSLARLAERYEHLIILRASSPLITARDMEDAYGLFLREKSDCLVTVKSVKYRLWREKSGDLDALLFNEEEEPAYVETKALFMLRAKALEAGNGKGAGKKLKVTPYFLNDRGVEINSYLDWWVCEKVLQSRHIVFVVAGYPAIGMGHIFRTLMLAHEIADHRITFLCTRESELAARQIAARDYHTKVQGDEDLSRAVLRLGPDLVINDILNTDAEYVRALKASGAAVVNFEDEGEGAHVADLVVNALYESDKKPDPHYLYGYGNFCLRDEFLLAKRNTFRANPKRLLITFGGTDCSDLTRQTLDAILPMCRERGINIDVVTGPGYAHKESLAERIEALNSECADPAVSFTHATNVMSRVMEECDLAICSAGRTVYELAHMRIPSVILSQHVREDMHTFARPRNGFAYIGVVERFDAALVRGALERLLDPEVRGEYYRRMQRFHFERNKGRVIRRILALLSRAHVRH